MAATRLTNADLRLQYQNLFDSCIIKPERRVEIEVVINRILLQEKRYSAVAKTLNMPWYVVAVIHIMECSGDFTKHLHNGDPLAARTVQVPSGRPLTGKPPFTWEQSAIDALTMMGFNKWQDWTLAGICNMLENYNGTGYRKHGINTPYLWSYSNKYTQGKYVQDGLWSDTAVSKQIGAAVILRRMKEKGHINFASDKILASEIYDPVVYAPDVFNESAEALQKFLNTVGATLQVDGKAGKVTSDAFYNFTGHYLKGDIRHT